ncbi:ABC transporter permease [Flaviflexus sp. JY899]|uniref:Transport permease protein n=1 Tax=Flaviflexus equikiangi TaxID=2758573 RepID=A0ABS2TGW3_9ACTO|nr:ABC transporter permease [Flaviflexus equikiangi]
MDDRGDTLSVFSDLKGSRELLHNLTMREIKGKYKRTALGQLWSLANPLALMVVYSFVFAIVIRVQPAPGDPSGLDLFVLWLMCALLPWTFFSGIVNGSMGTIVGNENLIKKVYFPRSTLIFANTLSALYQHLWEMLILVVAVLVLGSNVLIYIPLVAVTMVLLALFATGLGMIFAVANVYFRDVQHFSGILFQLWFYASPIVYPAELVKEQSESFGPIAFGITIDNLYQLNPFIHFAEIFRNLLYDARWPDWSTFGLVAAGSIAVFFIGWKIFDRHQDHLAEVL